MCFNVAEIDAAQAWFWSPRWRAMESRGMPTLLPVARPKLAELQARADKANRLLAAKEADPDDGIPYYLEPMVPRAWGSGIDASPPTGS